MQSYNSNTIVKNTY